MWVEFKGIQDKDEVCWDQAGSDMFLEDAASSRVPEPFSAVASRAEFHQV